MYKNDKHIINKLKEIEFDNFIIKPACGAGSGGVFHIYKENNIFINLDKFKDLRNDNIYINEVCDKYIVEEFINGTEHNLDIAIYDDVVYFWHVSDDGIDWQNFQDTQTSFPSKLKDKSKLDMFEQAKLILKALEIRNGVYHFEFKFDKNKSYLIELNPRRPGGKYVEYIERLYGNNLEYDDILIEIGEKPYMNKKALRMINPKKEICENEIFAHILNNESIGVILLKNNKFKKNLTKVKNLNYDFHVKNYIVVNGTHESEHALYNINSKKKRNACDVLLEIGKPNYIPILKLPLHEKNIDKRNVFFINNGTIKTTYRLYDCSKKTVDLSKSVTSENKVFLYTDNRRCSHTYFNCLYFSNLNI